MAVVYALLGTIVAEFLGAQQGMGVVITQAQAVTDVAGVFAALVILGVWALCCTGWCAWLERKVVHWGDRGQMNACTNREDINVHQHADNCVRQQHAGGSTGDCPRASRAAEDLKTVRFGFGQKALSANRDQLLIGEELGYNKAEGFTSKPMALGTQQQRAGRGGPRRYRRRRRRSFHVPADRRQGRMGRRENFYEYTYPYKWDIAVLPGSPIKSYQELKGNNIGVSAFGGTEYPVTRHVLRCLGIDPDKDVKWISVGNGLPAGLALQRGVIDALAYYDTGFGQIEAAGIKLDLSAASRQPADGRRTVPDGAARRQ